MAAPQAWVLALLLGLALLALLLRGRARAPALSGEIQRLVDALPGAVFTCSLSPDGRMECGYVSPQFERLLGFSLREALAHPDLPRAIVHPEDYVRFQGLLRDSARALTPLAIQHRYLTRGGGLGWAHTSAAPHRQNSGTVVWHGLLVDITAAKRIEDQNAEDQRLLAVGRLTGGVAHAFNNLLMVIVGNAELLEAVTVEPQIRDLTQQIVGSARQAAALTQHLLAFSRKQPLNPEPIRVNDAMSAALERARPALAGLAIEQRLAQDAPPIRADARQLNNALLNLLLNARDAMHDGGVLSLETDSRAVDADFARRNQIAPGLYAAFTVRDTGDGMTPEVRRRAFEPFFTTKTVGQGPGLGLSMVEGFTRQSGGMVELESAPGAGTAVTLLLPATEGAEATATASAGAAADPPHEALGSGER